MVVHKIRRSSSACLHDWHSNILWVLLNERRLLLLCSWCCEWIVRVILVFKEWHLRLLLGLQLIGIHVWFVHLLRLLLLLRVNWKGGGQTLALWNDLRVDRIVEIRFAVNNRFHLNVSQRGNCGWFWNHHHWFTCFYKLVSFLWLLGRDLSHNWVVNWFREKWSRNAFHPCLRWSWKLFCEGERRRQQSRFMRNRLS